MPYTDEASLILSLARSAGLDTCEFGRHLVSRITVLDYIRIADEIATRMRNGTILDWGCGVGQMSFLLQRRGLSVHSYDVAECPHSGLSEVFPEVFVLCSDDLVKLPYPDETFDAVVSCGVLEHVTDEMGSLVEIRRVLRAGGIFYVYNLPQRGSYKEFLIERLHAGYTHERKYSAQGITAVLARAGLRVERIRRAGMLPHNLTPFPRLRGLYNFFASPALGLDRWLVAVPVFNQIAESLEIIAVDESA